MRPDEPPAFEDDRIDWERKQRHKKSRKEDLEDDIPYDELEFERDLLGEEGQSGDGRKRRKVRTMNGSQAGNRSGTKRTRRSRNDQNVWSDWD